MRKEVLLHKKKAIVGKMVWYVRNTLTEEDIKKFSISQLELLLKITSEAEAKREKAAPFCVLSATEVLQKETGRIAWFNKNIEEETHDECMRGASGSMLANYLRNNESR